MSGLPAAGPDLAVRLGPLALDNPLVAASGVFGFGEEFARLDGFDFATLGAITLKGTTLEPRPGNPPPRIVETAAGLLNAIGLENPGVDAVVREHLPRLKGLPCRVIANVAGATLEEYLAVTRRFEEADGVDAIELNFSCPNVHQGQALGTDAAACGRALEQLRRETGRPLIVKLPPNVPDIRPIVRAAASAGVDAVTLVNTLPGLVLDGQTGRPVLGNVSGGLSGPAIKPVALLHVARARAVLQATDTPILGLGGICDAADALDFIRAGAAAVGLGTWLLRDPLAPGQILSDLKAALERERVAALRDLVGSAWD